MQKINGTAVRETRVAAPPLEEPHEIVRLEKEAKRARELVSRLDKAVLAKAFRSELVPQDENDESAEHLLARIRSEREAAPKGKRHPVERSGTVNRNPLKRMCASRRRPLQRM